MYRNILTSEKIIDLNEAVIEAKCSCKTHFIPEFEPLLGHRYGTAFESICTDCKGLLIEV